MMSWFLPLLAAASALYGALLVARPGAFAALPAWAVRVMGLAIVVVAGCYLLIRLTGRAA
jgi:hypothetical protein